MQRIAMPDGVVLKRHRNVFHLFFCLAEDKENNIVNHTTICGISTDSSVLREVNAITCRD